MPATSPPAGPFRCPPTDHRTPATQPPAGSGPLPADGLVLAESLPGGVLPGELLVAEPLPAGCCVLPVAAGLVSRLAEAFDAALQLLQRRVHNHLLGFAFEHAEHADAELHLE